MNKSIIQWASGKAICHGDPLNVFAGRLSPLSFFLLEFIKCEIIILNNLPDIRNRQMKINVITYGVILRFIVFFFGWLLACWCTLQLYFFIFYSSSLNVIDSSYLYVTEKCWSGCDLFNREYQRWIWRAEIWHIRSTYLPILILDYFV